MYSKKLMELFRHPKNVGEIKNADGVGVVGNPVCLLPNSKIYVNDHFKNIKECTTNDVALGHDGHFHRVKKLFKRNYSGNLIVIKNKFGKITLTEDHHVLAVKIPKTHKFYYNKNKKKLINNIGWWHASDIEKRDLIPYPILKEIKDINSLKLHHKKPKCDFKRKKIQNTIKINDLFLRLAGYYLAKGGISEKRRKTHLSFTFNIKEKECVEDINDIIKRIFNINPKIELNKERKVINILVYGANLTRLFKKLFNEGTEKKQVPHFMMLLPPQKQKSLICGLWRSDGHFDVKKPRAGYTTTSYQLAQQIKMLLLRQGIIPSFYEERKKTSKDVFQKKEYRIYIEDSTSLKKLASLLEIKFLSKKSEKPAVLLDENYVYLPVTAIEKNPYSGEVCNLEIETSKSFTSECATLHNCGDSMTLYIKVKDNKIKDIKFKTFGCAAAIATSSIITEMAKGKTLEDAEKISPKEIVDKLGGIPPIKYHCSVLAHEAIRAAIKDYRKKKEKKE